MNCAQYQDALHELVDGTLGPIRRAELQTHLDQCDACTALLDDLTRIRDLAASLDPVVPPARVWLQIAGHLRQEGRLRSDPRPESARPMATPVRRRHVLAAIAAALVLAIGASMALLFPLLRQSGDPITAATATATGGNAAARDGVQAPVNIDRPGQGVGAASDRGEPRPSAAGGALDDIEAEFRLAEQHYQAAIAKLEDAARSDTDAIDAQTAALIQKNLQVIDQAIAESRDAVRSEPSSSLARDSLFGALRRKVALLQDTIALMNEMRKGNAAGAARLIDRAEKG